MGEIKALTSLRGVAAMMVVLQHFSATAQLHSASVIPSLVPHGYMAVDLFFVLSGFIMAYTYLADFEARGVRAFPDFLLKRIARIVPLNVFAIALVLVAGAVSVAVLGRNIIHLSTHIVSDTVINLLMLQGLGFGINLNPPSWSISTECVAYLVFPALLWGVFAGGRVVCVLVATGCVAALLAVASQHPRFGLDTASAYEGLVRCFSEFVLGLVTFRLLRGGHLRGFERDWVGVAALGWMGMSLLLRVDLMAAAGFPFVVAALAYNSGRVARWMSLRWLYFLGEISFSIYLLHNLLRPIALEGLRGLHPAPLAGPWAMLFALLGSLAVIPLAWIAFRLVERPGRRFVRYLARGGRSRLLAPVRTPGS